MSIQPGHLRRIISGVLFDLDIQIQRDYKLGTEVAVELLMGTCAIESSLGHYFYQMGGGPAVGIFQLEPVTILDMIRRFMPQEPVTRWPLVQAVENVCMLKDLEWISDDYLIHLATTNIAFQICVARMKYLSSPKIFPKAPVNVSALAIYWKNIYNTEEGARSTDDFIKTYKELVVNG